MAVPKPQELLVPALGALSRLGGSGTFAEIFSAVSEMMGLTESDLQQTFPRTGNKMAKDRVGSALTALKMGGFTDYTQGSWIWSLTEAGRAAWAEAEESPKAAREVAVRLTAEANRFVRERQRRRKAQKTGKVRRRPAEASAPAAAGSYAQGYSAGAEAGRSEAKLLVRHWLDAFSKGGGGAALDELRRWAGE